MNLYYQAAADTDVVITPKPAILKRIIVGADVSSAIIEVSNHVSDGDGDVLIYLSGSTLASAHGCVIEVDAFFSKGITVDITNQTNVTFVWENYGYNG